MELVSTPGHIMADPGIRVPPGLLLVVLLLQLDPADESRLLSLREPVVTIFRFFGLPPSSKM